MTRACGAVIVTYNSAGDVVEALDAFRGADIPVVVVDNASADGTADLVESLELPQVTVVRAPNLGFGAGCNRGLRELGDVRHVLLLNPDARISPASLALLQAYLDLHPRAAVVAPRLYDLDQPLTSAGRIATAHSELRFVLPPRLARLVPDRRLPASFDRSGPVGVVEGACMLVDTAAMRAVGGFDERYFLFFEEHDLARRLGSLGREVHLCAEARADHRVGGSRKGLPSAGRDHYMESTFRYLRTWSSPIAAGVLAVVARCTWQFRVLRGRMTKEEAALLMRAVSAAARGGAR